MKSVKGFTLIEMVIAMILTSMVIIFSYSVINFITFQFTSLRNAYNRSDSFITLKEVMSTDVFLSVKVQYSQGNIECEMPSSKRITYKFDAGSVIRVTEDVADTFQFNVTDLGIFYKNMNQQNNGGLVDRVSFVLQDNSGGKELVLTKEYSAFETMPVKTMNDQ